MPPRRRPTSEFEATGSEAGERIVTIDAPIGGYQGYVSPDLLSPKFWAASSNLYSGQFGVIRRARWAPIQNAGSLGTLASNTRFRSMFGFNPVNAQYPYLIVDSQPTNSGPGTGTSSPFVVQVNGTGIQGLQPLYPVGVGTFALSSAYGPFMRFSPNPAMILQTNGIIRTKIFFSNPSVIGGFIFALELWGLDAPDSSAQITLVAGSTATISAAPTGAVRASNIATITTTAPHGLVSGQYVGISGVTDTTFNTAAGVAVLITVTGGSTFTYVNIGPATTSGSGTVTLGITKTVGRSYQWEWENANTAHTSAPSLASQFVKYASQTGTIDLIQPGTITTVGGTAGIVGIGTAFSPAWVGRNLWIQGNTLAFPIQAVADATHLTLSLNVPGSSGGLSFQVYDPQATHIRLYATGDGGSVYFLIGRNAFTATASAVSTAGLEFKDTANSEPPNPPFGSEITQIYNVPPPIGSFLQDYQGRMLVYGVAAALQTFFYSNIENTVVGQPPESFGTLNTVTMPIGDGQLNGMANLPTGLIMWSNRQDMFKLSGLLTDNTVASAPQLGATIQRLPYKIGCASPYATAVTPLGAIWLSSDREVWLFTDHYAPKNIGKPVQDFLNRINGVRLAFAKMKFYKRGDRSWLALAIALDSSTFNNKLLLLDLDLLASNGQPSFFTFDLATNAPTWYPYDINCEAIETAYDANSVNHLLAGDVDLITDVDWQPGFYTVSGEQNVPGNNRLHAFGNEDPHMIKTFQWMRVLTNQVPSALAGGGFAGHGSYLTLTDSGGNNWDVFVLDNGTLQTVGGSISTPGIFIINDPSNAASWQLGVTTLGLLTTTAVAFNAANPKTLGLQSVTGNTTWAVGVTLAGLLTTTPGNGWAFSVNSFDDDVNVIGVNPLVTNLIPGLSNNANSLFLEYSPALFKFGGVIPVKGRRFQIGTVFPSTPGLFELRGFEVSYDAIVGR
jgi:hypothetical protein